MNKRWMLWAVRKYLPDILTGMAMAGVPVTAWLSAEAGKKGATDQIATGDASWMVYIPPAVSGAMTMGCIFGSHRAHLHKEAMLMAVTALWSGKYRSLDKRVRELLGEERYHELRQMVCMDEAERTWGKQPPRKTNKQTYYEPYSHQYFQADEQEMLYAQLYINKLFQEYGGVTLNDYLNVLPGCRRVEIGRDIGWYQGTDEWEWNWSFCPQSPHFIDMKFEDLPNEPDVKLIEYCLSPSIPDEEWEPWR